MLLNITLGDETWRTPEEAADPSVDPLLRAWYGYRDDVSAQELWDHNRGNYRASDRTLDETVWVTLSYKRTKTVVGVIRLTGWQHVRRIRHGKPQMRRALEGVVLDPGDTAYDLLIGQYLDEPQQGPRLKSEVQVTETIGQAAAGRLATLAAAAPVAPDADSRVDDEPTMADSEGQGSGQDRYHDAIQRKKVEMAAQRRLEDHYRSRGWDVVATNTTSSWDAEARRDGRLLYLEAKGTTTTGATVIVTRLSVDHTHNHPDDCRIGIWSGIRFTDHGDVDPEAGTFTVHRYQPDETALRPRDFDYTPPTETVGDLDGTSFD